MEILIPILAVAVIGLICGVGLSVASAVMAVHEDERLPAIRECLPGANCGACGFSGCDGYAKALLDPATATNLCVPGGAQTAQRLAAVLGVDAGEVEQKAALVHCAGTCEATAVHSDYRGIPQCAAAKLFFGGAGSCVYGCLGLGDCVRICPNGAIRLNRGVAQADAALCTGCGQCAAACPQKLIEIVPAAAVSAVRCSNLDRGAQTRKACSSGCIGCKKCEKLCPSGAIAVENNLARIDYARCTGCGLCAESCPTGAAMLLQKPAVAEA